MHLFVYDGIDEELIKNSHKNKRRFQTIRTRCRWKAKKYSFIIIATSDLRKAIAELVKKLCAMNISSSSDCSSLESFVACILIPLNKNADALELKMC